MICLKFSLHFGGAIQNGFYIDQEWAMGHDGEDMVS